MAVGEENKVQFNLKNVHYAPILTESPSVTWDTPKAIPGAVSLTLSQVGEINKFYADGVAYWKSANNNGYEGDLEVARIPDQMLEDIWGFEKQPTDNVLIEKSEAAAKSFALLFQIDGDKNNQLYCMYNAAATRPGIDASTNEESIEPKPQKLSVSITPLADGRVKASTTAGTTEEVRAAWFEKVYEPAGA